MSEPLGQLSILVVDDNDQMRAIVGAILMGVGVGCVHFAQNGAEALQLLERTGVDIVFVDHEMPVLNGLEFIACVRSKGGDERYLPIVMLTGHSDLIRLNAARDAGVTEFLAKPVTARNLLKRLEAVIMHPRPFVSSDFYFGPDRRRRQLDGAPARRAGDRAAVEV